MRSLDGLSLEQIGRWRGVGNASVDPELGAGRLPAGSPPVYRPADGYAPGTPVPLYLRLLTAWSRQDLGPAFNVMVPSDAHVRGLPPTAPPTGASAARVPPAWAIPVSPDGELRTDSPARGTY